jgi:Flp pilus assembly pilin Flp
MIAKFLADESGATAIEYSLIAGMMLLFVVGIASTGGALTALYQRVGLISAAVEADSGA